VSEIHALAPAHAIEAEGRDRIGASDALRDGLNNMFSNVKTQLPK
jgi:hypothetical protein